MFSQTLILFLSAVALKWADSLLTHPEYVAKLQEANKLDEHTVDVNNIRDEYSLQMNNTLFRYGLPKCSECHQIGIIGAGNEQDRVATPRACVAGLVAGIELAKSGHTVMIYEANNRPGGRIDTYRDREHGYLTELGAMRLPLEVHPYLNYLIQTRYQLKVNKFKEYDEDSIVYINGINTNVKQAEMNPDMFGFRTKLNEKGKKPVTLWNDAVQPLLDMVKNESWDAVRAKWDSYSIDYYLHEERNLSRAAIDYISLMLNVESNLYTALIESIRDMTIIKDDTEFYHIVNGNDLLIESLVRECLSVANNRCSIMYNASVTKVQLKTEKKSNVQITWKNGSNDTQSKKYDSVIVATTATAASLIEFTTRFKFADKYRAMRQLHYDCASKVALFFNRQWWNLDENIQGGRSTVDLPVRFVYYHNFNTTSSESDGAAILASYTWSQDALLWTSLSEQQSIDLALENLNEIHAKTDVFKTFIGGKVKHWCTDPYSHGAFALFTPFQERDIMSELIKSVDNVHFIGEHTSSAHAWIEGAILSALRSALIIQEEIFDVVIIGGGPIGLATAIRLADRQPTLRIAIVEQFKIGNSDGSSGSSDVRQFRQMYSEQYLAELANKSVLMWHQLEHKANLSSGSILNTDDGYLFYGNSQMVDTTEGGLNNIKDNCEKLRMNCKYMDGTELQERFPFFSFSSAYTGIYHSQSGYINVTQLMLTLVQLISVNKNITIREDEQFLYFNYTDTTTKDIRIITNRGSLLAKQKVLFVPGPYAKSVSNKLGFDLNMSMWELPSMYFRLRSATSKNFSLPTWFAFAGNDKQSLYYGFPVESSDRPGYIKISPDFIKDLSNPLINPEDRSHLPDPYLIEKIIDWVTKNVPQVNSSDYIISPHTCLATFMPDNGFVLDYVPDHPKLIMYAAGWGMKFVPV
ncbi:unnamed protein product [Didymodactylos carnosus]|uniref:Uncharacterized protein n=1 Tax=Didymodactylos carnosus TaxID=1234261 RepID=A0A8S2KJK4_9BILA|nr:unnamed protein product [Didymodactylos carnosus]CAF3858357.1 unnamed protein product [Didymodactylos carnosus]